MSDARAAAEKADEKSADRLTTLSDGIFAIAMTLLVLDLHVEPGLDKDAFTDAVRQAVPDLGAYALSFTILAGFWRDHRLIVRLVPRFEGVALRFALMWLGAIALVPFPTALLSEYAARPLTVAVYAGMVAVTNLLELAMFLTGRRATEHATEASRGDVGRAVTADLASTAALFAATVPVAYLVSPVAAMWCWLALVPIKLTLTHRKRATARRHGRVS
ncbi:MULTISPECIES: TMEM175 family protein [Streptomyces]|uniref:TMEM175 family protein n=1 Tax=Streptomyces TaxID=1883 RepID=UPI000515759F|nr:TMEM175 family protein [Streptomyces sp. CNS654]